MLVFFAVAILFCITFLFSLGLEKVPIKWYILICAIILTTMALKRYVQNEFVIKKKTDADKQDVTKVLTEDQDRTVLYEDLNGGKAAGNVFSTRAKIAKAMNIAPGDIVKSMLDAISSPIAPKVSKNPEFRSKQIKGGLLSLPIPKYFPKDGGRYITAGVVVAEQDGMKNISFHRMMIMDDKHIAIRLVPRHTYTMLQKAKAKGEELKVAICVGSRPEVLLAAATSLDFGVDELEIAAALSKSSGKPLELGKTDNGLMVPADSDYVIEGRITLKETKEGPFVDITGTYDLERSQPIIEVDKIWSVDDPIFQLLLPGGNEHYLFMGLPREPMMLKTVRQAVPRTHAVRLTEGGCCWLHGVVSITKNKEGDGMNAIMAAFTGHPSMKQVIIVDEDIDIFDDRQVEWAVATRFQGNRMLRIPDAAGSSLDPSAEGTTWKVGIDATRLLNTDKSMFERAKLD